MTFSELFESLQQSVFPDGESRRLAVRHRNGVISDLIELQRYATAYREGNVDVYTVLESECGASKIALPNLGDITGVKVVDSDNPCDWIPGTRVSKEVLQRDMLAWDFCSCTSAADFTAGGTAMSESIDGIAGASKLREVVPSSANEVHIVLWLNTVGDGLGGIFAFIPSDNHADDGVDYIIPYSIVRPVLGSFVRQQL